MKFSLFRKEVLESHTKHAYGKVILIHPVSNYALLALAFVILFILGTLVVVGTYTQHTTVSGVLEPQKGIVKLFATQTGILKEQRVQEGQIVQKGEVLLVFVSEHLGTDGRPVEEDVNAKLVERLNELHHELSGTLRLHETNAASMKESLSSLVSSQKTLHAEIQTQTKRVQSAEKTLAVYENLEKSGFSPNILTQQKSEDLMDQQLRLEDLKKSEISTESDIARLQHDLADIPLQVEVSKAQVGRTISDTETELSKEQNTHEWSVVSPCSGVVTSLTITHNQTASVNVPLVTIVPSDSGLRATLYAPSQALGFVHVGQDVRIKLDAFSFQKFGFIKGKVTEIANSPSMESELSFGTRFAANAAPGAVVPEPYYRIQVNLDQQFVLAYGVHQQLRPGMQLTADIQMETRRLYEWVLEPLYSMQRT